MSLKSFLFVPGDRPERFPKAAASGADALILDLEDSVAPENKPAARAAVAAWLTDRGEVPCFVRINPLDSEHVRADLDAVLGARPDGIMLPKALGAVSLRQLADMAGGPLPPVLPIASEVPAAVFALGSYGEVGGQLAGLTWGAEDLPAAIGAATARNPDGSYTAPYETVRSLVLFAAHAAGTAAIETVYPNIADTDGLAAYVARGRRDGFTGMMAIHPAQVAIINAGFTPSEEEIAHARAVVDMFAANPGAGALKLDGKMIDRPHLKQAEALLARSGRS
ncbi:HpcH/HpaI aldolase/citrate lyase family protein [Rhizorhabdus dicambivorans]|uniref:CoA ester lyase n=1 Tax=Rhizorhabdus dicambivorans TaxID=1850238 RepID=A0A2A4FY60_9SPHN|nr:CoA ester lyase [Rhizorhabdus dicambivorans]ATE67041.1 CoA ester lyase [Rhizorhabdus dicambivorans]PCE43384.1 CoA ester lyase [Rhizorhabdus dicambivorans]